MWNNKKELKVSIWDAVVYLKLSFLKIVVNNVYGSWVVLVSSVFPLLIPFFKTFSEMSNNIWEWSILELEI